jgi:hypothetical protein
MKRPNGAKRPNEAKRRKAEVDRERGRESILTAVVLI